MIKSINQSEPSSNHTPGWAVESIEEFLDYVGNLERILDLSIRGISMTRSVPNAIEVLYKTKPDERDTEYEKQLKWAKEQAEFAQQEVDNGFPILHAQAIVSLWGNLESLIHVFLAKWLINEPKAIHVSQIQKLKVQLVDYESLDREERSFYIVDLLERDLQPSLRLGVSKFEALLEIFGLKGPIDETVKRSH